MIFDPVPREEREKPGIGERVFLATLLLGLIVSVAGLSIGMAQAEEGPAQVEEWVWYPGARAPNVPPGFETLDRTTWMRIPQGFIICRAIYAGYGPAISCVLVRDFPTFNQIQEAAKKAKTK